MKTPVLRLLAGLVAGLVAFTTPLAHAQLTIEISGAGAHQLPIAIGDFAGERIVSKAMTSVIRNDLERSGLFKMVDLPTPLSEDMTPPYADLKARGADAVLGGQVNTTADGRYETRIRLSDVAKQNLVGRGSLRTHHSTTAYHGASHCRFRL